MAGNIVALGLGQALTIVTGLCYSAVTPRYLGPSVVGEFAAATAVAGLLSLVVSFTTIPFLARELVLHPDRSGAIVRAAIRVRLMMAPAYAAVLCGIGVAERVSGVALWIFATVAASTLFSTLLDPYMALFQAREEMRYMAYAGAITQALRSLGAITIVVIGFSPSVLGCFYFGVVLMALGLCVFWARRCDLEHARMSWSHTMSLAKRSLPYVVTSVVFTVYLWADTTILAAISPTRVVGWYGVCNSLVSSLLFIPTLLNTIMYPSQISEPDVEDTSHLRHVRTSFQLALVGGTTVLGLTLIGARPFVSLVYGARFSGAVPVLQIMAFTLPTIYVGMAVGQGHIAAGRPGLVNKIVSSGIVVNVALNLILVKLFQGTNGNGAIGAALSLVATEVFIAYFSCWTFGFRKLIGAKTAKRFAKLAAAVVAMVAASHLAGAGLIGVAAGVFAFAALGIGLALASSDDRRSLLSLRSRAYEHVRVRMARPAVMRD